MYAKLNHQYAFSPEAHVQSSGWKDCTWVDDLKQATRLAHDQATTLAIELIAKQVRFKYVLERDQNAERNPPPYGLDNFVVRRVDI
jgi:hypothetical protein